MEHIAKDGVVVYIDSPKEVILDRMHKMKVDRYSKVVKARDVNLNEGKWSWGRTRVSERVKRYEMKCDEFYNLLLVRIVGQATKSLSDILDYRLSIYENSYDVRCMVTPEYAHLKLF